MKRRSNINARALLHKAQQLFMEGEKKKSIDAFTEAIEAGATTEIAFLSRGVAYLQTGRVEKAIDDFGRVVNMNDNNIRAHFYRGIACMSKEDFKKAVSDFDKTIELKPDHGAAYFARGSAYVQMGNEKEAVKNFKTALKYCGAVSPGFADTLGIFRLQFDKTMTLITEERNRPIMELTEDEIECVKHWLEE
ncbi:MAG: tetratricopeptide repeat protein [Nitrospirae bacterium]|nr:tetratricopeptide repeat protein [Nitrospirota bacterium]